MTSDGNTTTSATQDITTLHLTSNNGAVKLTSNKGAVTTQDVTSDNNTAIAANQSITTGSILSNNGAVKLTGKLSAIATGDITSDSDTTITADQSITTGSILSNNGAVKLTSNLNAIATGDITTGGNAAANSSDNTVDITLQAADGITAANLSTHSLGKVSVSSGKVDDKIYNSSGNVTFGSLAAKEVEILSNGGVSAQGDIETKDGDLDIIALRDIAVQKIIAQNGAVSLISIQGAITVQGELNSKRGLSALAKQNITTDKILSDNGAVLLSSSQGSITAFGEIASNGNVAIAALEDVVTQDITSHNGVLNLISKHGAVTALGEITSDGNMAIAALEDVITQDINSHNGVIDLRSEQGAVTVQGEINSGGSVVVLADQDITTGKILSHQGTVTLITEQGKVTTTGEITTNGGDSSPNEDQQVKQDNQPPVIPAVWYPSLYALKPPRPNDGEHAQSCFSILKQIQDLLNGFQKNNGQWEKGLLKRYDDMRTDRENLYQAYRDAIRGDTQAENYNISQGLGTWQGHQGRYERQQEKLQKLLDDWSKNCDDDDGQYLEGEDLLGLAEDYKNRQAPQQPDPKNKFQIPNINLPNPLEWIPPIWRLLPNPFEQRV